jgi:hypothetical protein
MTSSRWAGVVRQSHIDIRPSLPLSSIVSASRARERVVSRWT